MRRDRVGHYPVPFQQPAVSRGDHLEFWTATNVNAVAQHYGEIHYIGPVSGDSVRHGPANLGGRLG